MEVGVVTKKITKEILEAARVKQSDPSSASSDLVAAIHSLWMEIGLELGKEMEKIRWEETHGKKIHGKNPS